MNNKYNQVLKRPSKFSVVLDETDKEAMDLEEEEITKQQNNNTMEDIVSYFTMIN